MVAADGTAEHPVLSEEALRLLWAYGSAKSSYAYRQAADLPDEMVEEAERELPPAYAAIYDYIAALEAETLSARRELFAWKAQFAHRQRMKAGVRSAVTWLHRRADSMRDSRACGILHSAATNLGWELARVGPEGLEDAASRPVTGFFSSLTPEQQEGALAYEGPENIGEGKSRLDAEGGPVCQVHAGDGGEARRRQSVALDELARLDAEEIAGATPTRTDPFDYLPIALAIIEENGPDLPIAVACIHDAALTLARRDDPVPLAGSEQWVMGDDEFAVLVAKALGHPVTYRGEMLDDYAYDAAEMIRPRLVLAEG